MADTLDRIIVNGVERAVGAGENMTAPWSEERSRRDRTENDRSQLPEGNPPFDTGVPKVGPDDAGDVMRVDEDGKWKNKGFPLPDVGPEDDGKYMQVVGGKWKAAGAGNLPEVTETDNGKILRVVGGEWLLGDLGDKAPVIVESASGAKAVIDDGAGDMPVKSLTAAVGGGATGTRIVVSPSINAIDPVANAVEQGGIASADGQDTTATNRLRTKGYIPVKPGAQYTASWVADAGSNVGLQAYWYLYGADKNFLRNGGEWTGSGAVNGSSTVTIDADVRYVRFLFRKFGDSSATLTTDMMTSVQLELGSSASAYTAGGASTEYAVDWSEEAGAVSDGSLDVTNGKLTVGGTTFDITPVTVTTFKGKNVIWADCGDVSVSYAADTKLYIDNKIAALVATMSEE